MLDDAKTKSADRAILNDRAVVMRWALSDEPFEIISPPIYEEDSKTYHIYIYPYVSRPKGIPTVHLHRTNRKCVVSLSDDDDDDVRLAFVTETFI